MKVDQHTTEEEDVSSPRWTVSSTGMLLPSSSCNKQKFVQGNEKLTSTKNDLNSVMLQKAPDTTPSPRLSA